MGLFDHYQSPCNKGELSPPAHRVEGFNPLCGDEVTLTLEINDGTLNDLKFDGYGCSISQSSASMMTVAVKGKSIKEARNYISTFKTMMSIHQQDLDDDQIEPEAINFKREPDLSDLEELKAVVKFPVRIQCASLGWDTLAQALDELESPEASQ